MEFNATLLVSAVSFIIFVIIMNQILYKPVLAIMQKRQEYINNNKLAADEHGKNANALLEEKDRKIGEAHRKSRDIVAAKTEAIKNEKSKALNGTKSEMSEMLEGQKNDLYNEKNSVYFGFRDNVADIANNITTKLIGEGVAFEPLAAGEVEEVIRQNA